MTSPEPAVPPQAITDLGRVAYETWQQARGVPGQTWHLLTDGVQAHWETTARAVLEAARPHLQASAAHDVLCWEQPTDGRLIACDRKKGHQGAHSWEMASGEFIGQREQSAVHRAYAAAVAAERERTLRNARKMAAMCPGCDVFRVFIEGLEMGEDQP